jgi:hypothetical protein
MAQIWRTAGGLAVKMDRKPPTSPADGLRTMPITSAPERPEMTEKSG